MNHEELSDEAKNLKAEIESALSGTNQVLGVVSVIEDYIVKGLRAKELAKNSGDRKFARGINRDIKVLTRHRDYLLHVDYTHTYYNSIKDLVVRGTDYYQACYQIVVGTLGIFVFSLIFSSSTNNLTTWPNKLNELGLILILARLLSLPFVSHKVIYYHYFINFRSNKIKDWVNQLAICLSSLSWLVVLASLIVLPYSTNFLIIEGDAFIANVFFTLIANFVIKRSPLYIPLVARGHILD
jgi:hypothetical protein